MYQGKKYETVDAKPKGAFNNYVDKMRGEMVKKCLFVHFKDLKIIYARGGGGSKMAKFCPRSC